MENSVEEDAAIVRDAASVLKRHRPQDVVHVHVFRGPYTKPSKDNLSALVITGNGEVYGTGRNTMIGWWGKSPMPMMQGGPDVLEDYVKVEALGGLNLRKIVVGLGFGAGLDQDNQMYYWGGGSGQLLVSDDAIVMVQEYRKGQPCHCGNSEGGNCDRQGGVDLLKCPHSVIPGYYKAYSASSPPPSGVPVKKLIRFGSINQQPLCKMCGAACRSKSFPHDLCRYYLYFCNHCKLFREVDERETLSSIKSPHVIMNEIVDIGCGLKYLCSLYENKQVTFWSWQDKADYMISVKTPKCLYFKAINCGRRHFAAITQSGSLYMYGTGPGQSVDFTSDSDATDKHMILHKVNTPVPVEKVCCGNQMTICLLRDHSVWCFGKEGHLTLPVEDSLGGWVVQDIASFHCLNTFFLMGNTLTARSIDGHFGNTVNWKLFISNVDCNRSMMDNIEPKQLSASTQPEPKTDNARAAIPCWRWNMFGKKHLSDMILKLSDGDFFAHRVVLFGSSKYFKTVIADQDTVSTLDMTSYNPRAYRVLLQYFYEVLPDELDLPDLLDLFSIAVSYEEPVIVHDVTSKLTSFINPDNVLHVLVKAKAAAHEALIGECERVIQSSEFKDKVAASLFKDPTKFLGLPNSVAH